MRMTNHKLYRVAFPNFGRTDKSSDIYQSSQSLEYCTEKIICKHCELRILFLVAYLQQLQTMLSAHF